jgi:xanthine dehydrogenase accessory factor
MKDILEQVKSWLESDQSIALATVIKTWGSSPRPVGAGMAVNQSGEIAGSVSGGCVEGAVIQAAKEVINDQVSTRLRFGVADDEAWEVGLACGGEIEVFIRPYSRAQLVLYEQAYQAKKGFCSILPLSINASTVNNEIIIIDDGSELLLPDYLDQDSDIKSEIKQILSSGRSEIIKYMGIEVEEIFIQVVPPPKKLIIVGGVHIAIPLVNLAEQVGFEITVIDPRRLFGTEERFPGVSVIPEWPSSAFEKVQITDSTAIVMLTHDPKIDDPALKIALNSTAFYVGALGSRKTHKKRLERLRSEGITGSKLKKIHAPIGLDLGGGSPPEIAISIMSEIIQVWNKRG